MRKGKEIRLFEPDNFNVIMGSVDVNNPNTLYTSITSWIEPKRKEDIDSNKVVRSLNKSIKSYLFENPLEGFNNKLTILDLDLRESGIKHGKRSFMNLEVTFYQNTSKTLNYDDLIPVISKISNSIIKNVMEKNEDFKFNKKKV